MKNYYQFSAILAMAFAITMSIVPAYANDKFPTKPVKIVVPFPPGGTSDNLARVLAHGLHEKLGQPFIVDNKPGGGTQIGTQSVAKSPPDGYTLIWLTAPFAINQSLYKQLPYDTYKDFTQVINVASVPLVLVVNQSSHAKSIADLIKVAKEKPGTLTYGSSGNGGSPHLTTAMFASMAGIKLVHVPYKGSAPALTDLIGGHTDFVIDTLFLTAPQVQGGKLRALAQTGNTRSKIMPDVPTMSEAGLAGFEATSWLILAAPAGTPKEIIDRINKASNEVLQSASVRESLIRQGIDVMGGSSEDSTKFLRSEILKWGKVVRESGAKAD
jgi:tripartite-type tricarboxylate transporter receptor subunit TctC